MRDATSKAETAIGMSFINSPIVPLIIKIGINEKRVVTEAMMTGFATSLLPLSAAS